MAPVDPLQLLKSLSPLLAQNGAIKGVEETTTILSLMKDAVKMVSKCVYINILKATAAEEILQKFMDVGGWDIIYKWLNEAKDTENVALLIEVLKVYRQLPVTIEIMKKNDAAKTIKQLSKSEDERVKALSNEIVNQWMKKIREKSNDDGSSSSHEKKKKSKRKHREDKNKSSSHSDGKEKKESAVNNDSKHGDHSSERISKADKMDSAQSSHDIRNDKIDKNEKPPKEERKRPNTVKSYPSKFRSTGLEEASALPPKKKSFSTDAPKPIPKRPHSSEAKSLDTSFDKKPRLNLQTSVMSNLGSVSSESVNASPTEVMHGRIKLIPPRPKPPFHEIHDSSGFMDALTSVGPTSGPMKRRKKTTVQGQKSPTPSSPTTAQKLPQLPSFYRDTLETNDDNKENPDQENQQNEREMECQDFNTEKAEEATSESFGKEVMEVDVEAVGVLQAPASAAATVRKKAKKQVTWADEVHADEGQLRQVFYFELDETERENVNKPKDFDAMKKQEMMMDRRAMETVKRLSHDNMVEAIPWRRPAITSNNHCLTEHGCNSVEKEVQKQRELGVLQAIFFSKDMLPDGPSEPELEAVEPQDPKVIPLEDENLAGEEHYYNYDHSNEPPVKLDNPIGANLPPELANLMASLQSSPGSAQGTEHLINPVTANVQNLLASLMGDSAIQDPSKQDEMTEKLKQILEPLKNQLPGMLQATGNQPVEDESRMQMPTPLAVQMRPGQGLLGPAPPGFAPILSGPRPRFPPPGPNHPGPGDDWSDGVRGPPPPLPPPPPPPPPVGPMRGRARPSFPGRGRGMPHMGMRGRGRGRGGPDRPVCRHFTAPNGCRFGNSCVFLHPGINGPPLYQEH